MWENRQFVSRRLIICVLISALLLAVDALQFEQDSYRASIPENSASGELIMRVHAFSFDSDENIEVEYFFTSRTQSLYGHLFGICNATGQVHVNGLIDYEKESLYKLSVTARAKRTSSNTADTTVFVHILDENDNPPEITINTLSGTREVIEISENFPIGSFVAHVTVSDADTGRQDGMNCTLRNSAFALIDVDEFEYQIVTAQVFDRESRNSYSVNLRCEDLARQDRLFTVKVLHIEVTDVNDNAPKFNQQTYYGSLIGNNHVGASILQVHTTDSDEGNNARVRYVIIGKLSKTFQVNSRGGISLLKTVDTEDIESLSFIVYAVDLGTPPLVGWARVVITTDVLPSSTPATSTIEGGEYPVPEHCGRNKYNSHPVDASSRSRSKRTKVEKRILGGVVSNKGEWPWMVSIQQPWYNITDFNHGCGGSLIDPQWVLSAAHCFDGDENGTYKVVAGEHHLFEAEDSQVDLAVEGVFIYPGYRASGMMSGGDLALVKLVNPVTLGRDVNVVCLPTSGEELPPKTPTITSGWGTTEEEGYVSHTLRHVTVPIIDRETCYKQHQNMPHESYSYYSTCDEKFKNRTELFSQIEILYDIVEDGTDDLVETCRLISLGYNDTEGFVIQNNEICANVNDSCQLALVDEAQTISWEITDEMICAGWPEGARDSCQGDSGGPLVYYNSEIEGWLLAGVVSFGRGCGRVGYSGIYGKVSKFIPWIEQTIADNTCK